MGENTKIEWATHTFNPWIGCTKVSPGCDNCYAKTLMEDRWHKVKWGNGEQRVMTSDANWQQPIRWNKRAEKAGVRERVFCASLSDVFDEEVGQMPREMLFNLIFKTPSLDWLLLTKRPSVARRSKAFFDRRENAWLGVSVENRAMAELRIPVALRTAPRVFLSMEPLLAPVVLGDLIFGVGWVIVGGESGLGHRPMDLDWARALRDECRAAHVPFFFKQSAGKGAIPDDLMIRETPWKHAP